MTEKKMRLELLLAGPPTKKCLELQEVFQGFVVENQRIRLDIYYAGSAINIQTTKGYKKTLDKRIKIPMVFINGKPIPEDCHSDKNQLHLFIVEEFNKGEEEWQE